MRRTLAVGLMALALGVGGGCGASDSAGDDGFGGEAGQAGQGGQAGYAGSATGGDGGAALADSGAGHDGGTGAQDAGDGAAGGSMDASDGSSDADVLDADADVLDADADVLDSGADVLDSGADVLDADADVLDADADVLDADADVLDADADVLDADADVLDADADVLDADADVLDADADVLDSGAGNGNVWFEIDYAHAYTPQSPSWDFSPTPGWGEKQWAYGSKSWPEAWDRFNNMSVGSDPMGSRALFIGPSGQLQVMMGLKTMNSYDHATVRLEGRARETSSSVHFTVSNPANGCGVAGVMSNDWTIHVVDLDFKHCLVPGNGFQAIRVDTNSGTLALVRLRLTLFGASW